MNTYQRPGFESMRFGIWLVGAGFMNGSGSG